MTLSISEVLQRLAEGDFASIVGQFASQWLECKRSPYVLSNEGQRLELAKDVSALANASGGLILLGVSTKKDETHGSDVIDTVSPVVLAQFNEAQYRHVIAGWTWPRFTGVVIRVHPELPRKTHGVVSIEVAECPASDRPTLVCKTILNDDRRADIVFGYCERKQAGVTHHDHSRLHSLIGQGMRNREVLEKLEVLISGSNPTPGEVFGPGPSNIDGRINDAIAAADLGDKPCFVLAAAPIGGLRFQDLFASKDAPLVQSIERPPEIRSSGFDLTIDHSSHIVRGMLRRTVHSERKLLEMHRDGLVVFVNRGDQDGLCWGRKDAQSTRNLINQIVLIENVYLFALLVHDAYGGRVPAGIRVSYRLSVNRVCSPDRPCVLFGGPIDRWGYHGASGDVTDPLVPVSIEEPFDGVTPEQIAFLLLSEIYIRFGLETAEIPYAKDVPDVGRMIDVKTFLQAVK